MWPESLTRSLRMNPIVAVLVVEDADDAVPAARALMRGGIRHIELALRTHGSIAAMKAILNEVPQMLVGAGTVLHPQQLIQVSELGVGFAVAPGLNRRVVEAAREHGLPFAPGVASPSEIEAAYDLGCCVQKLFPAQMLGGVKYLKGVNAAYRHLNIQYIPLGGVTSENMIDWLNMPEVLAVGGS